jgi:Tfp pilus assembly protein PilN
MVQFNLLPDIKIQYLRARRQKHMVLLASVVTIAASLTVMVLLISVVFVLQKKNMSDLNKDIKTASTELQGTKELTKILTVQNQLKALPGLHDAKPVVNRLFGYINQSTPTSANISRVFVDFGQNQLTISGQADSLETVNVFVDTLKFTTYHTAKSPNTELPPFSAVVLGSFGRDNKGASYTITMKFDKTIFSQTNDVTLTVPKKVTTRSEVDHPSALFKKAEGQQ